MNTPDTPTPQSSADHEKALPSVSVPLEPGEITSRLDAAAKRGKMAGFHASGGERLLFTVTDFGTPFESVLEARAEGTGAGNPGTRLLFALRLKPRMIWVFAAILVVTVWPGVWLTDSMLKSYFDSYGSWSVKTWMWYLPLTVPFVPLGLWSAIKKSRVSGRAEAKAIVERIEGALGVKSER